MNFFRLRNVVLILLIAVSSFAKAQNLGGQENPIMTAVPFLMIAPDARAGSMGDAGVSTAPDANSTHWNPAKLSFIDKDMGVAISYSPWLHKLVSDINLAYISGFKKFKKNQTFGASLRYFNMGDITFTDDIGTAMGNFRPNEFAVDGTYARLLTKSLSMAVSARFINSNLTDMQMVSGQTTKKGRSVAADIAVYQQLPVKFENVDGTFAWGLNLSNLGAKISYSDDNQRKDFLPTNLRFGPRLSLNLDEYNSMSFTVDVNKLLVPTLSLDSADVISNNSKYNVSPVVGLIHSFYDAPGGFGEEMRELSFATGIEYWYDKQFALRGGFFYEDKNKGNRKYFTLGAGLRYNVFGLDFSYLIPLQQDNPLANTLRFALLLNFDDIATK